MFCLEFTAKVEEYEEAIKTVDKAYEEIKSKKVVRCLEYILAVGNYINNPQRAAQGFKFGSLIKVCSLLHFSSSIPLPPSFSFPSSYSFDFFVSPFTIHHQQVLFLPPIIHLNLNFSGPLGKKQLTRRFIVV